MVDATYVGPSKATPTLILPSRGSVIRWVGADAVYQREVEHCHHELEGGFVQVVDRSVVLATCDSHLELPPTLFDYVEERASFEEAHDVDICVGVLPIAPLGRLHDPAQVVRHTVVSKDGHPAELNRTSLKKLTNACESVLEYTYARRRLPAVHAQCGDTCQRDLAYLYTMSALASDQHFFPFSVLYTRNDSLTAATSYQFFRGLPCPLSTWHYYRSVLRREVWLMWIFGPRRAWPLLDGSNLWGRTA